MLGRAWEAAGCEDDTLLAAVLQGTAEATQDVQLPCCQRDWLQCHTGAVGISSGSAP